MIDMTHTVRTVTVKKGHATAMIDGAPVQALVDRLEVELVSDNGETVRLVDLPIVSAAGLDEQRAVFAPGAVIRETLAPGDAAR